MIHAFIFARGGSKRLPGKNMRMLCGKPLIAHAIAAAKQSGYIERIFVSTDDQETAYCALKYGADVIERPWQLSQGESGSEWRAWRHALENTPKCDVFVSVPAVCPLRIADDIDRTIQALEDNDAAVTVTPLILHPFGAPSQRSQERKPLMNVCAVCYVAKPSHILNHESLWDGKVVPVEVPKERAIDIDDIHDFVMAEALLTHRGHL